MQMGDEDSNTYPVTKKWVTTPVAGRKEEEQEKVEVERAIKGNSADIQNWTVERPRLS